MKKIIMAGLFCLSLLMVPAGTSQVQASQASATTEFVYRGTSSTVIDRGPGVSGGKNQAAKTGVKADIGGYLMLASGSGVVLLLLSAVKKKSEDNKEAV